MSSRELITLQFGHYANFVGTHLWNLQCSSYSFVDSSGKTPATKEINFDATFREGKTLTGEVTYTPRAIFFDLKGSLNTLKQDGNLYDFKVSSMETKWPTDVTLHEFSGAEKNEFLLSLEREEYNTVHQDSSHNDKTLSYNEKDEDTTRTEQNLKDAPTRERFNLDSVVNVWSDFLKPHIHPKTISLISSEDHVNADAFNLFPLGLEAYKQQRQEAESRLRFFTEECDNMQGFQILVNAHDAFGGFASALYEDYIQEEFGNKNCFVVNTIPYSSKLDFQKSTTSLINLLLSYNTFASSSILPLSTETTLLYNASRNVSNVAFSFLDYDPTLPYHTSAILASTFNNITLPYRLLDNVSDLNHYLSGLTNDGRKVLGIQMSLPFAVEDGNCLFDLVNPYADRDISNNIENQLEFVPLTPCLSKDCRVTSQNVSISGMTEAQLYGTKREMARYRYSLSTDLIKDVLYRHFNTTLANIHLIKTASRITEPYPHIFRRHLNDAGIPSSFKRRRQDSEWASSIPIATLLQNNPSVGGHLQEILGAIDKIRPDRLYRFHGSAMEADDFKENLDQFRSMADSYENNQPDMH